MVNIYIHVNDMYPDPMTILALVLKSAGKRTTDVEWYLTRSYEPVNTMTDPGLEP